MLKIINLSVNIEADEQTVLHEVARALRIKKEDILSAELLRRAVDARKKPHLRYVLTICVRVRHEKETLRINRRNHNISLYQPDLYQPPVQLAAYPEKRPIVIGFGPAGIFAAYILAMAGARPVVFEQGKAVEERKQDVEMFRHKGILQPWSNVQFGEGGAGTFSDGKLTTGLKDSRIRFVLNTFVEHGAPDEIRYTAKPHIGTDRLSDVIASIRRHIVQLGGEVHFGTRVTKLHIEHDQFMGAEYTDEQGSRGEAAASACILAIGHSARDLFTHLHELQLPMERKTFAVGVRIEHHQRWLDKTLYGREADEVHLPHADYKLAVHLPNGHNLYTFCMCPGGEVVAAASEQGHLVVNGMSDYRRSSENCNSALLVEMPPNSFPGNDVLAGIHFQRQIEQNAFQAALEKSGKPYTAPACCLQDFLHKQKPVLGHGFGCVTPSYIPGVVECLPDAYLPETITQTIRQGLPLFGQRICGFDNPEAVLTGVESRSSSPVRVLRNSEYVSPAAAGLYPCGEGAGYAGGIMSAAIDGIRCAEALLRSV